MLPFYHIISYITLHGTFLKFSPLNKQKRMFIFHIYLFLAVALIPDVLSQEPVNHILLGPVLSDTCDKGISHQSLYKILVSTKQGLMDMFLHQTPNLRLALKCACESDENTLTFLFITKCCVLLLEECDFRLIWTEMIIFLKNHNDIGHLPLVTLQILLLIHWGYRMSQRSVVYSSWWPMDTSPACCLHNGRIRASCRNGFIIVIVLVRNPDGFVQNEKQFSLSFRNLC